MRIKSKKSCKDCRFMSDWDHLGQAGDFARCCRPRSKYIFCETERSLGDGYDKQTGYVSESLPGIIAHYLFPIGDCGPFASKWEPKP